MWFSLSPKDSHREEVAPELIAVWLRRASNLLFKVWELSSFDYVKPPQTIRALLVIVLEVDAAMGDA